MISWSDLKLSYGFRDLVTHPVVADARAAALSFLARFMNQSPSSPEASQKHAERNANASLNLQTSHLLPLVMPPHSKTLLAQLWRSAQSMRRPKAANHAKASSRSTGQ